jgi:hypothetical protein
LQTRIPITAFIFLYSRPDVSFSLALAPSLIITPPKNSTDHAAFLHGSSTHLAAPQVSNFPGYPSVLEENLKKRTIGILFAISKLE